MLPAALADRIFTLIALLQSGYFDTKTNLSALVFYGGFVAAKDTLASYPLGVGFLNMASAYDLDTLSAYRHFAGDTNINDGSSVLFKIVTEFGYIGVVFAVYSFIVVWRYFYLDRNEITIGLLAFPLIACFVRGGSYLDGPVLIALVILMSGFSRIEGMNK